MKPCLRLFLLLVLPTVAWAEDHSDFHVIQGFSNPALKAGHYLVSLVPHFGNVPYEASGAYTQSFGSSTSSSQFAQNGHLERSFDVVANSVYGISDAVTLALSLGYAPSQSLPQGSYQTSGQNSASVETINQATTGKTERLNAGMALSYRPRNNVEMSVNARYANFKNSDGRTGGGTQEFFAGASLPIAVDYSSRQKQSVYDVWLSLVVLSR